MPRTQQETEALQEKITDLLLAYQDQLRFFFPKKKTMQRIQKLLEYIDLTNPSDDDLLKQLEDKIRLISTITDLEAVSKSNLKDYRHRLNRHILFFENDSIHFLSTLLNDQFVGILNDLKNDFFKQTTTDHKKTTQPPKHQDVSDSDSNESALTDNEMIDDDHSTELDALFPQNNGAYLNKISIGDLEHHLEYLKQNNPTHKRLHVFLDQLSAQNMQPNEQIWLVERLGQLMLMPSNEIKQSLLWIKIKGWDPKQNLTYPTRNDSQATSHLEIIAQNPQLSNLARKLNQNEFWLNTDQKTLVKIQHHIDRINETNLFDFIKLDDKRLELYKRYSSQDLTQLIKTPNSRINIIWELRSQLSDKTLSTLLNLTTNQLRALYNATHSMQLTPEDFSQLLTTLNNTQWKNIEQITTSLPNQTLTLEQFKILIQVANNTRLEIILRHWNHYKTNLSESILQKNTAELRQETGEIGLLSSLFKPSMTKETSVSQHISPEKKNQR